MAGLGRVKVSDIGNSGSVATLREGRRRGCRSFALVSLNVKRIFVNFLVGNPQERKGCGYDCFGKGIREVNSLQSTVDSRGITASGFEIGGGEGRHASRAWRRCAVRVLILG